jgi:hypothetical protein
MFSLARPPTRLFVSKRPRGRVTTRPRGRVTTRVADLDALVREHVCPMYSYCEMLLGGSEQHQHAVVSTFRDLARTFNINHGAGYVLRALLADDPWTALRLAEGFDSYNIALERVHDALTNLPEVDVPPNV